MRLVMLPAALLFGTLAACDASTSSPAKSEAPPVVTTVQPKVQFPQVTDRGRAALEALPAEAQKRVPSSPVPVLVPTDRALSSVTLMVDREYYALFAKIPGGTIHVQGTRARVEVEGIPQAPGKSVLRGGLRAHLTENEGIRVASWMENEVSYAVDLECESPEAPMCASDKEVVAIANGLVHVGGGAR